MRETGFLFDQKFEDDITMPEIIIGEGVEIHADYEKLKDNEHEKVVDLLVEDDKIKETFGENARRIQDEKNEYSKTHVIILRKFRNPLKWKKVDRKKIAELRDPKRPFGEMKKIERKLVKKSNRDNGVGENNFVKLREALGSTIEMMESDDNTSFSIEVEEWKRFVKKLDDEAAAARAVADQAEAAAKAAADKAATEAKLAAEEAKAEAKAAAEKAAAE